MELVGNDFQKVDLVPDSLAIDYWCVGQGVDEIKECDSYFGVVRRNIYVSK